MSGRITVSKLCNEQHVSSLESSYPIKLILKRRRSRKEMPIVYGCSYGGGLVSQDTFHVHISIETDCSLCYLTQGSTKVFRRRRNNVTRPLSSFRGDVGQSMQVHVYLVLVTEQVASGALFCLLPEAVTLFKEVVRFLTNQASYEQYQHIHLQDETSSCIILDWITSGRMNYKFGEVWEFERYASRNILQVGDYLFVLRDGLLLESPQRKLERVNCLASLFVFGPRLCAVREKILHDFNQISIGAGPIPLQPSQPEGVLWSASPLLNSNKEIVGCVLRASSLETRFMKKFLAGFLEGIKGHDT